MYRDVVDVWVEGVQLWGWEAAEEVRGEGAAPALASVSSPDRLQTSATLQRTMIRYPAIYVAHGIRAYPGCFRAFVW